MSNEKNQKTTGKNRVTSKPAASKTRVQGDGSAAFQREPGFEIFMPDASAAAFSNDGSMVRVDIRETIVDRRAGTRSIERIWGDEANVEVMAVAMTAEAPGVIREEVSNFFMSRRIAGILEGLTAPMTIQPGDRIFLVSSLVSSVQAAVSSRAAVVILEFVIPYLRRLNMIADTGRYTAEIYYPNANVQVDSLTEDVVVQHAADEASRIDVSSISANKHTKQTFAAAVAEKLVSIGENFMDSVLFTDLFDDIKVGIRERLTMGYPHVWTGDCPTSWRNDPVVKALSSNYVFVKAALELPATTDATPVNSLHELSDRAKLALAALNTSRRYAIVSAGEFKRFVLKKNLRDQTGIARMFMLARNAEPFAVAQTVTAFADSVLPDVVTNIGSSVDGLDKFLAAGYAEPERLSVRTHFEGLCRAGSYLIEAGYRPAELGYAMNVGGDAFRFGHELCALSAAEVWLTMPDDDDVTAYFSTAKEVEYEWVFGVRTTEREFRRPAMDARILGDMLYTSAVGEVLIALEDSDTREVMPARPQLLSKDVEKTRLVQFDQDASLLALGRRYSFNISLGGQEIQGSFYNQQIGFMSTLRNVFIVKPAFNIDVLHCVADVYGVYDELLAQVAKWNADPSVTAVPTVLIDFVKRHKTTHLVEMGRGVSKVFRHAVQQAIAKRALTDLDAEAAALARGQLQQQQFAGYADLYALYVFLDTQGVCADFVSDVISAAESLPVILELGSDRIGK